MVDYYKALNVSRKASLEDIKKSYKSMAIKYHPDKNPDNLLDETIFKNLAIAYGILSNPEKRMEYDKKTSFSNTYDKYSSIFGKSTTASNFGKQPVRKSIKGEDIYHDIIISLEDIIKKCKQEIKIVRNIKCGHCDGTGIKTLKKCHKCVLLIDSECKICFGSGLEPDILCDKCNGTGLVQSNASIEMDIPSDIKFGEIYTLVGKGHAGKNGGSYGDFIVRIFEKECDDKRVSRNGFDIHYVVDVSIIDLVLGTTLEFDVFSEKYSIIIGSGTQPSHKTIYKGKGLGIDGNMIIDLNLVIPTVISDEQRELYEKLKSTEFVVW